MPTVTNFGHEAALTPATARAKLVKAYEAAGASNEAAAKSLGLSLTRFYAYAKQLGVDLGALAREAKENGLFHRLPRAAAPLSPDGKRRIAEGQKRRRAREKRAAGT